jgi:hypothetical protein
MLSLKHNFLFIHLPKTAGNSIQGNLQQYSEEDIVCLNDLQDGIERFEIRNQFAGIHKHSGLRDYQKVLEPEVFRQLYIVSTIRNPWERLISFYFSPHRRVNTWDRDDFIQLVNNVIGLPSLLTIEQSDNMNQWHENASFIMRYEHIEDDFKKLCEKLNIAFSPLHIRNKSQRNHFRHYYDRELVELVALKFKKEIEYGNYVF